MKATFYMEVATPGGKFEGRNVEVEVDIPFVPAVGMKFQVLRSDDYRAIEDVMWGVNEGLAIFFECDENTGYKNLLKMGWKPAD